MSAIEIIRLVLASLTLLASLVTVVFLVMAMRLNRDTARRLREMGRR